MLAVLRYSQFSKSIPSFKSISNVNGVLVFFNLFTLLICMCICDCAYGNFILRIQIAI